MSTAAAQSQRNGVDTARLFATLDAVKAQPDAARFRFSVAHRLRFAAHTFLIRRDRPPRHALMNTTTWRIAALMLAAPRRGTAGAGGREWTLA